MTRSDNNGLYGTTDPGFKMRDLNKRVEIVNSSKAKLLISIHQNTYTSASRRGAQTFYKKGDKSGEKLAKFIQGRINGMRLSPRLYSHLWGDYYLLNESKITSVIVECGFLSSPEDEKLLLSDEYRNDISLAIFNGSLDFFCA
jgi:N-acetylmuramoyl-L-alanine amidase